MNEKYFELKAMEFADLVQPVDEKTKCFSIKDGIAILKQVTFDQREACAKALNECYHFEYTFYGAIYLDDAADKVSNAEM